MLRGEEFNSVNEAAPRLMKALADGINVPVGALRKMAEEGKLTSAVLSEALPKALGQLREEAKEVQTIGGAFTVLKNNIMEMVGAQSNASGTTKAFAAGINALANNLDLLAAAGGAVAVVMGARFAASITASGVAFAASAVQAARYQSALASMVGVSTTAAAGLVTMGAAARGASAAMSLLGARSALCRPLLAWPRPPSTRSATAPARSPRALAAWTNRWRTSSARSTRCRLRSASPSSWRSRMTL